MKKLSILFVAILVAALAGCAGDTTSPEGGDLAIVQTVELDAASTGRTIVITWAAVDDVEGYKLYFATDGTGTYTEVADVATTTATHTASNAGTYMVMAYDGDNTSSGNSNEVSTMPNIVNTTYTIYDNYSPADTHSGFIFGATSGTTGSAASASFVQDMYAYDESKGDESVWLYSGNFGAFGNGNQAYFQTPESSAYGDCDPNGTWYGTSYMLYTSDSVVFVELPYTGANSAYAKIRGLSVTADPDSDNGTVVSFTYEYQPNDLGLTVFTSSAN